MDNKKKRSIVYFSTFGPCLICLFDNKNRRSILSLICVFDNCIWPACLDLANGGKNLRSSFTGSWLTDYLHFHGLLSFILKIMLLGQLSHDYPINSWLVAQLDHHIYYYFNVVRTETCSIAMCLSIARLIQHCQEQQELIYLLSFVICAKAAIITNDRGCRAWSELVQLFFLHR